MNYFEKSDKELWQESVDKTNDDRLTAVRMLAHRLDHKGKYKESMALLETTLSSIDKKIDTHDWLDITFLVGNTKTGLHQYAEALVLHSSCLPIARESMDLEMIAYHARNSALCKSRLNVYDKEWLSYLDEACSAADDSGDIHLQSHIHNTARYQYYYGREFEKSLNSAKIVYDYWDDRYDTDMQALTAVALGSAYIYTLDLDNAEKYLSEAISLASIAGNEGVLQSASVCMGKLALLKGDIMLARKNFKEAGQSERMGRDMEETAAEGIYWRAVVTRDYLNAKKGQKHLDLIMPAIKKFEIENRLVPLPGL
jgi:tetratricopeptide (TPR) repeat protein